MNIISRSSFYIEPFQQSKDFSNQELFEKCKILCKEINQMIQTADQDRIRQFKEFYACNQPNNLKIKNILIDQLLNSYYEDNGKLKVYDSDKRKELEIKVLQMCSAWLEHEE